MKQCTDCNVEKTEKNFSNRMNYNTTNTVYKFSICNDCRVERQRKWVEKNKERYQTYQKQYQLKRKNEKISK